MKISISILISGLLLSASSVFLQKLFTPTQVNNAYTKGTRRATGEPGNNYWQNKGDYNIHVNINPSTQLLSGLYICLRAF